MGSYVHVDKAAKERAIKRIEEGRITPGEAAVLVGVSAAAVSMWLSNLKINWRKSRAKWVERDWQRESVVK